MAPPARLWHTAILSKWKPIFEFIPLESQIEKFQDGYYQAIADCHKNGSSTKFIEFMLEQISSILDALIEQTQVIDIGVSDYVKKLLDVMEPEVPYSSNALLTLLSLKSKENLRKKYLGLALDLGLIEMTIPQKPKSKNQKYIKR